MRDKWMVAVLGLTMGMIGGMLGSMGSVHAQQNGHWVAYQPPSLYINGKKVLVGNNELHIEFSDDFVVTDYNGKMTIGLYKGPRAE